jgi:hypothetical protein
MMFVFKSLASGNFPGFSRRRLNSEIGSRKITHGCCLLTKENFRKFPAASGRLGRSGSKSNPETAQWILDLPETMELIEKSKGNPKYLWKTLGLSTTETPLEDTLLCVINPIALWNLREATKDTPGANSEFVPNGYTSGFREIPTTMTMVASDGDFFEFVPDGYFTSGGLREMVIDQIPTTTRMVASDGDFFIQKYVSTVPIDDLPSMYKAVEIAALAQKQVTSTLD